MIRMSELLLPYNGKVLYESQYGYRTLKGEINWHNGVDLVGLDSKILIAPCDGIVKSSAMITDKDNKTWEWGNYIRIDWKEYSIFMCHMEKRLVFIGEEVHKGQAVGIEGDTGYSFGSHCHFEMRKNGASLNPCSFLGIEKVGDIYQNEAEDHIGHEWSEDAIHWAIKNGLIKGYSDSEKDYRLEQNITREEMIVILYRYNNIKNALLN